MRRHSEHYHSGILRKLLLVNLLIIVAFSMIALSVVLSFRNIGSFSGTIINKDVNEVVKNAQLGRDLGVVFAESDLLLSTFMNREKDVRVEGERILLRAKALEKTGTTPELEGAIGNFVKKLQTLFWQCSVAHDYSVRIDSLEREMEKDLSALEGALSRKLISLGQQGKDVSMLEQISMLLLGYREALLQISISHARMSSRHPEAMDAADGKRMLALLDDLQLRLKTLTASEPFVAAYGARLSRNVQASEGETISFLSAMGDLKTRLGEVKKARESVTAAMKEADENISQTAGRMKGNISAAMRSSGIFILITSGTIIICLVLFTLRFSYMDFRHPMELIRQGIDSIRGGNLETTIRMERRDEWGEIEDALNGMVKDLKGSYWELQEKNLELEVTQSDLENKVTELEMEMKERQRAEEALWESEQRLHATIQGSPIPIFVIDRDMKVIYWNTALERLSGTGADEVIGTEQAWKALYEEEQPVLAGLLMMGDPAEIERWYGDKFSHSRLVDGAYEVTDFFPAWGEGGKWLHITAAPLRDAKGELIGAIETLEDISEQKLLEEQLRHSQKMDAIGQLAGGVAHDFNNILTGIMGFANMLQLKMGENETLGRYVKQIILSAQKGAKLTHSLLAFSRKNVIEQKAIRVNEIIHLSQKLLSHLVREDIELRVAMGEDCLIRGDSMQIEQVLMNLVTNACDAMPEGGIVTISTERVEFDEDYIRSHGYGEPGSYVLITVSDSGIGMDEKTRDKIFEPFFTTKKTGKGTGLGLAIVYGIIKEHNGYVNVHSEPGKGSAFRLYLPLITDVADEEEILDSTALTRGTESVLLAEDDPIVREMTKALLEEFGYRVFEAEDGADAVEKFISHRDEIRMVILDVIMPRKNGKEAYMEIRSHEPGMKALFISGYTGDILSRRGILDEGLNFISKPVTQSALLQKVREVLDS
jgi:signal transduction histidine kinase/methyl-accepting chemotaxis protein